MMMSGPFGVSMTLISGRQQSGEIVLAAATFLSMTFLTIDCVCTDRNVRMDFLTALRHFTDPPGMHTYKSPDSYRKALAEPDNSLSTQGIEGNDMQIEALMEKIVAEVKRVRGVRAIVLGGSRARGTQTSSSDIDLAIYYHPDDPPDLVELGRIATELDDEHRAHAITEIGGWGPWINGGGWLKVASHPVDLLYRDLRKVSSMVDDCLNGKIEIVYQPGHPHGFVSSIYLSEAAVCLPLWDPDGILAELKRKTTPYPENLQRALIQKFAWEIDFSLQIARKSIERTDVIYAAGCCFRSAMCMLQVLFAINGEHWLNEKGAVAIADSFARKPSLFKSRIEESFALLDADAESIRTAIVLLEGLSSDIHGII